MEDGILLVLRIIHNIVQIGLCKIFRRDNLYKNNRILKFLIINNKKKYYHECDLI
jgi:hypothetical protein